MAYGDNANTAEKELVRRFGQWLARWDIGFFAMEHGSRYCIDDPDRLQEKFRLLAKNHFELCLELRREFDAGYSEVMSQVEVDREKEEEELACYYWFEPEETEQQETEQETRTEQVYNCRSWQPLPEYTEEERKQYWSRVRSQVLERKEKEIQEKYRRLVSECLRVASGKSGSTAIIKPEVVDWATEGF